MDNERKKTKKITFTYPVDVLDRMRVLAKEHGRSFIGEIVWALRQYIQGQDK